MEPRSTSWFDKIATSLIPTLKIRHRRWRAPWEQRERKAFLVGERLFFFAFALAYVLHFFLIDLPLHKEPISLWSRYRFGLAAASTLGLLLSFTRWHATTAFYRLPLALVGLLFVYFQGQSMIWRAEVPYFYSIILAVLSTLALRKSVFESVGYLTLSYLTCIGPWTFRPQELPYTISAAIVGAILVVVIRSRMSSDVDSFLAQQEKLETQTLLIEAQQELNDQIQAFLPREIFSRISHLMTTEHKTVLQAMDEILRPKECLVSCLFSDIRGHTQMTKAFSADYVVGTAIPSQRTSTEMVERYCGIPRLTGDLLFAYFDDKDPVLGLRNTVLCGFDLLEKNALLNQNSDHTVSRPVIISFGKAVVGNIGGSDGAREITVLGEPANILSRIDPATKTPALIEEIKSATIILSEAAAQILRQAFPRLNIVDFSLSKHGIILRDYPENQVLGLLTVSREHRHELMRYTPSESLRKFVFLQHFEDSTTPVRNAA